MSRAITQSGGGALTNRRSDTFASLLQATMHEPYQGIWDPELGVFVQQDDVPPNASNAEAMAVRLVQRATRGDLSAIREVLDRTEGRPVQTLNANIGVSYVDLLDSLVIDANVTSPDPEVPCLGVLDL